MSRHMPGADWVLPAYVAACLLLGGASAAGVLANLALQLAAAAIILWLVLDRSMGKQDLEGVRGLLFLAAAFCLIPLLQLVPLPAAIWQQLPGRQGVARLDLLFGIDPARPVSLQPGRTLSVIAGFLPPLAALLLTIVTGAEGRARALHVVIGLAALSVLIGTIQILQGPDSQLYFYRITNFNTSVGFFANGNHLATLLLVALVLGADPPYGSARTENSASHAAVRAGLALLFLIGLATNRSLAGLILAIPACLFLAVRQPAVRRCLAAIPLSLRMGIASGLGLVGIGTILFLWRSGIAGMIGALTDPAERLLYLERTWAIIRETFPVGTGLGTFRALYASHEDPAGVTSFFVNHAHDDYAEFLLEAGILAPALLVGLAAWLGIRLKAMRQGGGRVPSTALPAAMALFLIAAHSLADYPLRTSAIAAVAAMCLGLLTYPSTRTRIPADSSASR